MAAESTRTRVLRAAGPIFADKGFDGARVRDICRAARVNLAAVNYYFGDKERLYIEAVKLARQSRAQEAPLPAWTDRTPTEQKLRDFIHTLMARLVGLEAAPWQVRLMMREVLQPTAACRQLVQEYFRPQFNVLVGILDEVLPADVPEPKRHQIGFSIIGQCVYYRMAGQVVSLMVGPEELRRHYTVDQLADHVTHWSLAALGQCSPLGAPREAVQNGTGAAR